jgi:alanine racemase
MANSCATFRGRRFHGNMVRIGQSLLGYLHEGASSPAPGGGGGRVPEAGGGGAAPVPADDPFEFAGAAMELRPVVRWTSSIVHVKEVPAGFPVGYGQTWRAKRPTRIALVPVGYADGYPRSLSSTGVVTLTARHWDRTGAASGGAGSAPVSASASKAAAVIGRVSMDQITIDVTDVPEPWRRLGAEVELVSPSREAPNHFPRLAGAAGTITHELLCRLGPRVERAYRFPGTEAPMRLPTGALHRPAPAPVAAVPGSAAVR